MASNALQPQAAPSQAYAQAVPQTAAPGLPTLAEELTWRACESPSFVASWDDLAARASEPNPFHESWFLLPSLRTLDAASTVSILVVLEQGKLAGILPMRRESSYYRKPIPHLSGWTHPNSFLGAPLVAAGCERLFWQGLLDWADRAKGMGLFLHLTDMPLHGPLFEALTDVLDDQGRRSGVVFREERAMLETDQSPEAWLNASTSAKARSELRRKQARLAELGKVAFEWQFDDSGIERWIDHFLALEASGWKGKSGTAIISRPETSALFREALIGCAQRGKLERLSLTLDDRPLAMLTSFLSPPGAFGFKIAFDEEFGRYSPGMLLQRENLKLLDRQDIAWSDSCAGPDNKMISQLWPQRREIGRISIAIGGALRRALFARLLNAELRRNSTRA